MASKSMILMLKGKVQKIDDLLTEASEKDEELSRNRIEIAQLRDIISNNDSTGPSLDLQNKIKHHENQSAEQLKEIYQLKSQISELRSQKEKVYELQNEVIALKAQNEAQSKGIHNAQKKEIFQLKSEINTLKGSLEARDKQDHLRATTSMNEMKKMEGKLTVMKGDVEKKNRRISELQSEVDSLTLLSSSSKKNSSHIHEDFIVSISQKLVALRSKVSLVSGDESSLKNLSSELSLMRGKASQINQLMSSWIEVNAEKQQNAVDLGRENNQLGLKLKQEMGRVQELNDRISSLTKQLNRCPNTQRDLISVTVQTDAIPPRVLSPSNSRKSSERSEVVHDVKVSFLPSVFQRRKVMPLLKKFPITSDNLPIPYYRHDSPINEPTAGNVNNDHCAASAARRGSDERISSLKNRVSSIRSPKKDSLISKPPTPECLVSCSSSSEGEPSPKKAKKSSSNLMIALGKTSFKRAEVSVNRSKLSEMDRNKLLKKTTIKGPPPPSRATRPFGRLPPSLIGPSSNPPSFIPSDINKSSTQKPSGQPQRNTKCVASESDETTSPYVKESSTPEKSIDSEDVVIPSSAETRNSSSSEDTTVQDSAESDREETSANKNANHVEQKQQPSLLENPQKQEPNTQPVRSPIEDSIKKPLNEPKLPEMSTPPIISDDNIEEDGGGALVIDIEDDSEPNVSLNEADKPTEQSPPPVPQPCSLLSPKAPQEDQQPPQKNPNEDSAKKVSPSPFFLRRMSIIYEKDRISKAEELQKREISLNISNQRDYVIKLIEEYLNILWKSIDKDTFEGIIDKVSKEGSISSSPRILIDMLYVAIKSEKSSSFSEGPHPDMRSPPSLTLKQKKVIAFVHALDERPQFGGLIGREFMSYLYFSLIGKGRMTQVLKLFEVLNLVRTYVSLSRLRGEEERVKTFLFDVIFFSNPRMHAILYSILGSWPDLFTWMGDGGGENADPILEASVWIVYNTGPSTGASDFKVHDCRKSLQSRCGLTSPYASGSDLVEKLISRVRVDPGNEVLKANTTKAFLLISKAKDTTWSTSHLINPLLTLLSQENHSADLMPWVVESIGDVSRIYLAGDRAHLAEIFNPIKALLVNPEISQPLEAACIKCLIRLGHHLQLQTVKFFASWNPRFPVCKETELLAQNFLGTRAHEFTHKQMRSMRPTLVPGNNRRRRRP